MTERCKAGAGRCWSTELDNKGEKQAGPVNAAGELCEKCVRHVARLIDRLPDDWEALAVLIGARERSEAEHVAYTPTPGIPLNVTAEAHQTEMLELIDIAADMVTDGIQDWRDHEGRPVDSKEVYRPPRNQAAHLAAGIDIVAPNLDTLLAAPTQDLQRWDRSGEEHGEEPTEYRKTGPGEYVGLDRDGNELAAKGKRWVQMSGVDVALALWALHGTIRSMFGMRQRDMRRRMPMPCHGCGNTTLYREYGEELIKCSTCPPNSAAGRGYDQQQYDRLAGLSRFHLRVKEDDEMRELDEANARADAAEQRAADAEAKLARVAEVAGHTSVAALMAIVDGAGQ